MRSRQRVLGIVGAVIALALAAGLVLLAADARAWRVAVRDDDVLLRVAPRRAAWAPRELAPFHLGRHALGVEDDLRLRRAIRLFHLARRPPLQVSQQRSPNRRCPPFCRSRFRRGFPLPPTVAPVTPVEDVAAVRISARIALARVGRGGLDPGDRALAASLIGVLAFDEARGALMNSAALLRQSTDAFRRAVVLDPRNEDAKTNLEILLRLTGPGSERARQEAGLFLDTAYERAGGASRAGRGY